MMIDYELILEWITTAIDGHNSGYAGAEETFGTISRLIEANS